MATRPAQDFEWATSGTKVDPGSGKKDTGFVVAERPPASWFNYLLNLIAQWITYLRDLHNDYGVAIDIVWGPVSSNWGASQNLVLQATVARLRSGTSTAGEVVIPGVAVSPQPHTALLLRHLNASTNSDILVTTDDPSGTSHLFLADPDGVEFSMEWRSYLTAVGSNELDVVAGFNSDPDAASVDDATTQNLITFRKLSADTNWQARVANASAGATIDTGIPPVASTWQRFKIEYHGSSTATGVAAGGAIVRWYIDGAKVAERITSQVPSGSAALGWMIRLRLYCNGSIGSIKIWYSVRFDSACGNPPSAAQGARSRMSDRSS